MINNKIQKYQKNQEIYFIIYEYPFYENKGWTSHKGIITNIWIDKNNNCRYDGDIINEYAQFFGVKNDEMFLDKNKAIKKCDKLNNKKSKRSWFHDRI